MTAFGLVLSDSGAGRIDENLELNHDFVRGSQDSTPWTGRSYAVVGHENRKRAACAKCSIFQAVAMHGDPYRTAYARNAESSRDIDSSRYAV